MDFSDDDEVPERDIRELNAMGWARQTFGNTDRNVMSKMLKLLFDDFYIKRVSTDRVDNIYTPREMTPEQIEWLENWQAWERAPSNPPPWPETKSDEFNDDGGRRQSSQYAKRGIWDSLVDFLRLGRLTSTR
ncbi:hypothetical protein PgNI_06649 [Pyricularia grisea]|uniref:Uncharacterized protein n=1 Tax=Pyricularia grisea TaxID=148305 RepID=A0A6P8B461_PYRGI|nr:hypothetical protein PgNI_06649 [Pyricularia grisea]TLD10063.1 hypothetical protein PgNI_06649 [Pyricularia grisea]